MDFVLTRDRLRQDLDRITCWNKVVLDFLSGFGSESDEVESEGAEGLESDEDGEDKERLLNAKEGMESEDDKIESRKRTNSEDKGSQRKKKKSRQIVESDEDSD